MANLLSNASLWTDGDANNPPSIWTGSTYDFVGDDGNTNTISATASDGDVVAFDFNSTIAVNGAAPSNFFIVLINGSQVFSFDARTVGSGTFTSNPLSNGDAVTVQALTEFVLLYSCDITVTPLSIAPPIIATPPQVVLRWSDDGGHTWSNEQLSAQGAIGKTAQRVMWRRIGSTRRNTGLDRVFEVSSDDENQVALVGSSIGDG